MNAPLIWVFLPIFSGIIIWLLRERESAAKIAGIGVSGFLFILTFLVPLDTLINVGVLTFQIPSEMSILGRNLVITSVDLPFISLIFGFAIFWFIGSLFLKINHHFPAISLVILGLMIAAISVEPFLYAALIIELVVLVTIPLFVQPGMPVGKGVIRFLQFQTLAMPFILYAGWTILGVEANRSNEVMIQQTIIALGLGFALWLAVFPFYSWIPLLTTECEPYTVGFFLLFYPITTLHLGLKFLNTYSWLRESIMLQDVIQGAGIVLILTSGILCLYQRDIRKLFGYLVIMENGFSLLAISLNTQLGYQLYFASMFPRLLIYALWTYSTTKLASQNMYPTISAQNGIYQIILFFTLLASIGLPLLGNGALRVQIITHFTGQTGQIGFIIFGILGYGLGILRTLSELIETQLEFIRKIEIRNYFRFESLLLFAGLLAILVIGLLPNLFAPASNLLIQIYDKLIA
jgi:NADH-quinone oxidoreductase subunit N